MTVGIAVKYTWTYGVDDFGPAIITASDRMLTTGYDSPIEHTLSTFKGAHLGKRGVMLMAGAIQVHGQLYGALQKAIPNFESEDLLLWDVATKYGELLREYYAAKAEERYLAPLKISTKEFLENSERLPESVVIETWQKIQNYQVDFEAVVTGVDKGGAHLFHIDCHGNVTIQNDIGYATVGLGGTHAAAHLMTTKYDPSLPLFAAEWAVFGAKKRGEAAPGVGPETDLIIINRSGKIFVDHDTVRFMEKLYRKDQKERAAANVKSAKAIQTFIRKREGYEGD